MRCLDCDRQMVARTRRKERPKGSVTHRGRGLCDACYRAAVRYGDIHRYEPRRNHAYEPATEENVARARRELDAYLRARRARLAA